MFDSAYSPQNVTSAGARDRTVTRERLSLIRCLPGDPGRAAAERFVRERFFRTHEARVESFLPVLLTLSDRRGKLRGIVGCRFAESETLFLERYLAAPIETALAERIGIQVPRAVIAEVGNLACRNGRVAQRLMSLLPGELLAMGCKWIAFTATASVRDILRRLGARPIELATADRRRIADGPDYWGRYYHHDPRVMAGYLPAARHLAAT